jgi:hypothetical protein
MEKTNREKVTNFWFGFAFGGLTLGALTFFLGTKKGRQTLKKVLEVSENLEEDLLTYGQELLEKGDDLKETAANLVGAKQTHFSLGGLLDKMRVFSPRTKEKQAKRFFFKENKT